MPSDINRRPTSSVRGVADGERSAPRNGTQDARHGPGTQGRAPSDKPDVFLHVPDLHVGEIYLDVEDLDAHLSLQARLANLVQIVAGVHVHVGKVELDIKDVDAEALLKVRLENLYSILDRALTTIDRNPEILEGLLQTADTAVGTVGETAGQAVQPGGAVSELAGDVGEAGKQALGPGGAASEAAGKVGGAAQEAVGPGGAVSESASAAGRAAGPPPGRGRPRGPAMPSQGPSIGRVGAWAPRGRPATSVSSLLTIVPGARGLRMRGAAPVRTPLAGRPSQARPGPCGVHLRHRPAPGARVCVARALAHPAGPGTSGRFARDEQAKARWKAEAAEAASVGDQRGDAGRRDPLSRAARHPDADTGRAARGPHVAARRHASGA